LAGDESETYVSRVLDTYSVSLVALEIIQSV